MTDLDEPCPFCARRPYNDPRAYYIQCSHCAYTIRPKAAWNSRPLENGFRLRLESANGEIEELKSLLKIAHDDIKALRAQLDEVGVGHG